MNLRTLKKLSKRAAPLLAAMGDDREQFPAEKWENYGVPYIADRKHHERSPCHPSHEPWDRGDRWTDIKRTARAGHTYLIKQPSHPRKGTIMVGGVSGYYEPEWDETTAWCAFCDLLYAHFTDWASEAKGRPAALTRPLNTVGQKFAAAAEMIAELSASRAALTKSETHSDV